MSLSPNGSGVPPEEVAGTSFKAPKVCGVCGDRAKSYHFGGISCDSCKAFFRRSVQNEAYKNFHCPYEGRCDITITSRKCCQSCRFQKCLSIGMEKGWVMTEEERMLLLKSRMEKRQKQETAERRQHRRPSLAEFEPDVSDVGKFLGEADIQTMESLVNLYEASYRAVPFSDHLQPQARERTRTEILDMFFTVIKQFAHFAQRLETFAEISQKDQEVLLRTGVLELCFIRGSYTYDEKLSRWPDTAKPMYRDAPVLYSDDMRKLVSPELFEKHMRFIRGVKELDPDEATTMLLLVIVLLSPDRPGLTNAEVVAREQERFYILMKKYMTWRYGLEGTAALYPKLLLKLPDLRELTDAHTDYHLRLARTEMEQIQQRLSSLRIDTTPQPSGTEAVPSPDEGAAAGRRPWSLRRDVLRWPSSPVSPEEESSSSEGSERFTSFRQ